jgi:hypothetical protein
MTIYFLLQAATHAWLVFSQDFLFASVLAALVHAASSLPHLATQVVVGCFCWGASEAYVNSTKTNPSFIEASSFE